MTECIKKKLCTYQEERAFYSALGTHSEALVTYKNYVIFTCSSLQSVVVVGNVT